MFTHIDTPVAEAVRTVVDGVRYYKTPEGILYPSVTTVLGAGKENDLDEWKERVGEEQAIKIGRQAANRGTRIHKYCEDYLSNQSPTISNLLDLSMFNTMKKYLDKIDNVRLLEGALYSDHLKMAGTVDCVGEYANKLSVIDYKTSAKEKIKEWITGYFLQTTIYAIMFEERTGIPITQLVIIIGNDQGSTQVFIEHRNNWIKQVKDQRKLYKNMYGC